MGAGAGPSATLADHQDNQHVSDRHSGDAAWSYMLPRCTVAAMPSTGSAGASDAACRDQVIKETATRLHSELVLTSKESCCC